MRKLKVGYWPLSADLNSPGDRRRLVNWANTRGHTLTTDLSQKLDVVVASENSDLNSAIFDSIAAPIVYDLVDAYLSPRSPQEDLARGLAKRLTRQISGKVRPYSEHVKNFCMTSDAVICSSIEQEALIRPYNSNSHVILDSHAEIPFLAPRLMSTERDKNHHILWEGQPATIRGVRFVLPEIASKVTEKDLIFNFVTDEVYFKLMNRFIERNTLNLLRKELSSLPLQIRVIPWSTHNLQHTALISSAAIIPIDLSVPIQRLKPENRLLIMWRLGLPCFTSNSLAYVRVANEAGVDAVCETAEDWNHKLTRILSDPKFALEEVYRGQDYLNSHHNESKLLRKWDLAIESVLH